MHVYWDGSVHCTFALFCQVGNRWHYISEEPSVSVGLLSWIPCGGRLQVVSGMKRCCSSKLRHSEDRFLIVWWTNHDLLSYFASSNSAPCTERILRMSWQVGGRNVLRQGYHAPIDHLSSTSFYIHCSPFLFLLFLAVQAWFYCVWWNAN
jgi:hypothetical protein